MLNVFSPKYIYDLVNISISSHYFRSERKADLTGINSLMYGLGHFDLWNSVPNDLHIAEPYHSFEDWCCDWMILDANDILL